MSSSSVQVAVRVRPFLPHESGSTRCVEVLPGAVVPSHLVVEEEDESDSEDVEENRGPLSQDSSDAASQSADGPGAASHCARPRRRTSTVRRHHVVKIGGDNGPTFTFDHVLPSDSSQREAYDTCVAPLVRSCLEGYNATVLAYGQTGSGKTHTILGPASSSSVEDEDEAHNKNGKNAESQAGVIPRALRDLFNRLNRRKLSKQFRASDKAKPDEEDQPPPQEQQPSTRQTFEYEVRVQFLELYGEEVRDLLSTSTEAAPRKGGNGNGGLAIRDGAVGVEPEVIGATETTVESANDALLCLTRGMLRRVTGSTAMNAESSRSHAIMTVVVEQTTTTFDGANGPDEEQQIEVEMKRSKFHFVDLAGSERQKRSLAEGKRLKEGIDINKGLLVLGNVISALGDPKKRGKSFVPYRDSKLTRLLKGSLGGNHKTLMIACVSPASSNLEESLNCLRYANRAKNIQNNAVVNVDAESRLLNELRTQVKTLAGELLRVRVTGSVDQQTSFPTPTLRSLAAGGDAKNDSATVVSGTLSDFPSIVDPTIGGTSDELKRTQQLFEEAKKELQNKDHEVFALKAEREYYRLQLQGGGSDAETSLDDDNGEGKVELTSFVSRVAEYERELTALREALREAESRGGDLKQGQTAIDKATAELEKEKQQLIALQRTLQSKKDGAENSDSPSRTTSKTRSGEKGKEAFDDEYAAEQAEIKKVTDRFAPDFDSEAEDFAEQNQSVDQDTPEKTFNGDKRLDSHLTDLSRSIAAKEQLIHQLQVSQEKYETMRDFYEDKLRNMESQVRLREAEREQLVQELKKQEQDSQRFIELQTALEAKEQHLTELRERQQEVLGLSKISSENETMIMRLQGDVHRMKQQKSDLQRQMVHERKVHLREVRELKKQNMQQDKETNRWKKESDRVKMEAENAQRVAKHRLEEVGKLRSKYKEAEKKLRMQTLKRGVMERAGLDAVMVGRREVRSMSADGVGEHGSVSRRKSPKEIDVEKMRAYLDEKVADVSRKEAAADKLAQEWEDHMDLLARKEELMSETENAEDDDALRDDVEAVEVQIQFKEDRIRQLGRKLGDKPFRSSKSGSPAGPNQILEDRRFKQVCGGATPLSSAQAASRVLFGMVVRERRRVTSLARAAALLDQKAVEATDLAKSKDEALRTHLDDFRRERATLAQSSQRHILSLMNMVQSDEQSRVSFASREEKEEVTPVEDVELNRGGSASGDSMVLILANERIAALEKQLAAFQGAMQASEVYKAKDAETSMVLEKKCSECKLLGHEITVLRTALRQIRENLSMAGVSEKEDMEDQDSTGPEAEPGEASAPLASREVITGKENDVEAILQIITNALHAESSRRQKGTCSDACEEGFKYADSPGKKKIMKSHVAFLQSSDSEDEGEEPEWAGDIMADLALIAEGRLPPTLKASKVRPAPKKNHETTKALNQLGKTRSQSSGTSRPSRGSLKSSNSAPSSNSNGANVFERLTDPDNFTGIQKHSFTSGVAKVGKANAERGAARAVTENGKNGSPRQISDQRKRAVGSPRRGRVNGANEGNAEKRAERLQNPSRKQNDKDGNGKSANSGSQGDKETRRDRVAEYTSRDVFERLQKTNTQSYAGKQNNQSSEESDTKRS